MNRRRFLLGSVAALAPAGVAWGADLTDRIVRQLQDQGYREITVRSTLLGRVRITAISAKYRREIVFNPRNGEILRDYWESLTGDSDDADHLFEPSEGGGSGGSGSGGSGSGGGKDDEDEGEDEREEEDESDDEDEGEDDDHS